MFFEFHPTLCVVKDAATREILLRGVESGGLYKLDFSKVVNQTQLCYQSSGYATAISSPHPDIMCESIVDNSVSVNDTMLNDTEMCCFSGKLKMNFSVLHQRLGHPSNQTLSLVAKSNNLVVISDPGQCVVCAVGKSCKLPFSDSSSVYTSPRELVEMDF